MVKPEGLSEYFLASDPQRNKACRLSYCWFYVSTRKLSFGMPRLVSYMWFLGGSVRVFPEEMGIWIDGLSKVDGPSQCGCLCAKSFQSFLTLHDPADCSPPGSSVHGILQARILEWAAMPSSRGSSQPRDWTRVLMSLTLASRFFITSVSSNPLRAWIEKEKKKKAEESWIDSELGVPSSPAFSDAGSQAFRPREALGSSNYTNSFPSVLACSLIFHNGEGQYCHLKTRFLSWVSVGECWAKTQSNQGEN